MVTGYRQIVSKLCWFSKGIVKGLLRREGMPVQRMTKDRLDRFRNKLSAEIICLEAELREMEETDKGMGISTILDYRTGYPIPQGVSGFEWDKYCRKHDLLNRKRQEQKEVREWIEAIEDIQTRWVFRMWYIERLSWKKIAKKMGVPQNEDYPRLMVRDKYLKNNGIK
jgi:hypothetical protein